MLPSCRSEGVADMIYEQMDAQCFARGTFEPLFAKGSSPVLRYICKISPEASQVHTRVMHAHEDLAELVFIFSGASRYLVHDRQVPVKSGDLLIYNRGVVHDEYAPRDSGIGYYCAGISDILLPGLSENMLIRPRKDYVFHTGAHSEEIRVLMEMMYDNLTRRVPNAERICDSLMHALIDMVLLVVREQDTESAADTAGGRAGTDEQAAERGPQEFSIQIKEYIDRHYREPLTLETIGTALHLSPWYLSHLFKEMTGYSPFQYLARRRIGEAQTLLISTDASITDIAFRVGYETQSYFNAQFTKHVGMPPNQFRKKYVVQKKEKEK